MKHYKSLYEDAQAKYLLGTGSQRNDLFGKDNTVHNRRDASHRLVNSGDCFRRRYNF